MPSLSCFTVQDMVAPDTFVWPVLEGRGATEPVEVMWCWRCRLVYLCEYDFIAADGTRYQGKTSVALSLMSSCDDCEGPLERTQMWPCEHCTGYYHTQTELLAHSHYDWEH